MSDTTTDGRSLFDNVYRQLAQRLDAIPNSFPATESGVELRLLQKIFAPEEATLAAVMRLTPEPAADIADRAGVDAKAAARTLKGMARKGQIRVQKGRGQLTFELMPFVVGIYEMQLPRMDAELLASAKSWGVIDCICWLQQRLVGKGCDRPIENCLVFAPVEDAFSHGKLARPISREDAQHILREAAEVGLVHSSANHRGQHNYICNCCTCCCGVMRGVAEFGIPTAIARSDFHAVVDAEVCAGCGDCVETCQFQALSVPGDTCEVDYAHCVGCGLCATVCPTDALHLERRPDGEVPPTPADDEEWMAQRARERGISIADVL